MTPLPVAPAAPAGRARADAAAHIRAQTAAPAGIYRVFGGALASPIGFPELPRTPGAADWVLETVDPAPAPRDAVLLGTDDVEADVRVHLYRDADGYRLVFDDTGTFEVLAEGARLTWAAGPRADERSVRLDVLGRVLPLAMHAAGTLTLHGSAVAVGGSGIGFLGPKHFGKSTLSQALVAAGARLATDDALPVALAGGTAWMRPGVPAARLWGDSLAWLRAGRAEGSGDGGGKTTLAPLPAAQIVDERVPLAALYVLAPRRPEPTAPPARRARLPAVQAALALVAHAKLGPLLGRGEAALMLDRASRVADALPVYRLELVRDFAHLPAVVDALLAWHREASQP